MFLQNEPTTMLLLFLFVPSKDFLGSRSQLNRKMFMNVGMRILFTQVHLYYLSLKSVSTPLLKLYRKYKYPSSINTQIRRYATHHEISQESQDIAQSDFPFFERMGSQRNIFRLRDKGSPLHAYHPFQLKLREGSSTACIARTLWHPTVQTQNAKVRHPDLILKALCYTNLKTAMQRPTQH